MLNGKGKKIALYREIIMKVECERCGKKARGRLEELTEIYGWKIIFIDEKNKVIRCKKHSKDIKEAVKDTINALIFINKL